MKVREICKPEYTDIVFQRFDYFNDFQDTIAYVKWMEREASSPEEKDRLGAIVSRLEKGNREYIENWNKEMGRINKRKQE